MTILNKNVNNLKVREIRFLTSEYVTDGKEAVNDIILIAKLNYNTIFKSLKISSDTAYNGFTADIILLNEEKEEIKYGQNNANTLSAMKSDLDFTNVLTTTECLPTACRFETIEEDIIEETNLSHYRGIVYVALKIKTVPATPQRQVKVLTDISFIENI